MHPRGIKKWRFDAKRSVGTRAFSALTIEIFVFQRCVCSLASQKTQEIVPCGYEKTTFVPVVVILEKNMWCAKISSFSERNCEMRRFLPFLKEIVMCTDFFIFWKKMWNAQISSFSERKCDMHSLYRFSSRASSKYRFLNQFCLVSHKICTPDMHMKFSDVVSVF